MTEYERGNSQPHFDTGIFRATPKTWPSMQISRRENVGFSIKTLGNKVL